MSNGVYILLIFGGILLIPLIVVVLVLVFVSTSRKKKNQTYAGRTAGRIEKIVHRGSDFPWIIYVTYSVNGVQYQMKESAKLKCETMKAGPVPVGQRKTFVLGPVKPGDTVTVCYDVNSPDKAIIYGNDGIMTG